MLGGPEVCAIIHVSLWDGYHVWRDDKQAKFKVDGRPLSATLFPDGELDVGYVQKFK